MEYCVTHITKYESAEPVSVCHNQAWLTPRDTDRQTCLSNQLEMNPEPSTLTQQPDAFGNTVTYFSFNEGYRKLQVKSVSRISVRASAPIDKSASMGWDKLVAELKSVQAAETLDAYQFSFDSPRARVDRELADYARSDFPTGRPVVEAVSDLTSRIYREFEYDPKATTVTTPILEVLNRRRGVCQDFAHLEIGMLRSLGMAARYVSGYIRTYPPEGQARLVGADASHAWLSVYCGDLGWVDFDPTNDTMTNTDHVTVAWGRDYSDVTPLRGVYTGGGRHILNVSVDVSPVDESTT